MVSTMREAGQTRRQVRARHDPQGLDRREGLRGYRSRYQVESRIRNVKSELIVRPVFLHNCERIRALVFGCRLALLVYTLMEILPRRSRIANVWGSKAAPITARELLLLFGRVELVELTMKDRSRLRVIERLDPIQLRVMKRLAFLMPESYVKV